MKHPSSFVLVVQSSHHHFQPGVYDSEKSVVLLTSPPYYIVDTNPLSTFYFLFVWRRLEHGSIWRRFANIKHAQ